MAFHKWLVVFDPHFSSENWAFPRSSRSLWSEWWYDVALWRRNFPPNKFIMFICGKYEDDFKEIMFIVSNF